MKIAIEYEHSLKFSNRYRDLFDDYYYNSEISGVLYFCRNKNIIKRLSEVAEKVRGKDQHLKIFFADIEKVYSKNRSITFIGSDGTTDVQIS